MDEQELKAKAKELAQVISTMAETQTTQTRVLDRMADGLNRAIDIIADLKHRVIILEEQVKELKK